jgi:thioredoxin reductase
MAKSGLARLAVLGAGPVGLEAALYARTLGYPVTVYERGQTAEAMRHWGHVQLFTPFVMNHSSLGRRAILETQPDHAFPANSECLTGWRHREVYLEPLASCGQLKGNLRLGTEVLAIGKAGLLKEEKPGDSGRATQPFHLLLRDDKQRESTEEAEIVLDCTGVYGRHRWVGDGGIPAGGERPARNLIAYGVEDVLGSRKQLYAGKAVMVVGGGYSAATTIANLAQLVEQHPEMWITWLVRSTVTQPLRRIPNDPFKVRDRLAANVNHLASRTDANIHLNTPAIIDSIELMGDHGLKVNGRLAGKERSWEVDRIIANVGYSPDNDLYRELQVQESFATLGPKALGDALVRYSDSVSGEIPATGPESLRTPEPNFYLLGSKSFGRLSPFFMRYGFGQIRDLFRLISGKNDLDLYKSAAK